MKKNHLVACLLATLCLPIAAFAAPSAYSVRESDQMLVRIDLGNGTVNDIGPTGGDDIDGLAFSLGGILYGSDNDDDQLVTINTATGARSVVGDFNVNVDDTGLAFNSSGVLFLSDDTGPGALYTVNTTTAALTLVGLTDLDISAISFDSQDVLHAIDDTNNALVILNIDTGAVSSTVGGLGFSTFYEQGMAFDKNDNLFMVNERTESLYSVDTTTGTATLIADLGADYEALAILVLAIPVIEPANVPVLSATGLTMLGMGLSGLAFRQRRKNRKQ